MSAIAIEGPIPIIAHRPPTALSIPIVDFSKHTSVAAQQIFSTAATTTGLIFIRNLPMGPNFAEVQHLFDNLYQNPLLAARLNSTYPKRGVFKIAGRLSYDETVDEKVTIDLSAQRLEHMNISTLRKDLGNEFEEVVRFFKTVEEWLVPLVLKATSNVISPSGKVDLLNVHREGNNNFRLTDYHHSSPGRYACGEHTDYGTATIIFQDGNSGLEFQDPITKVWCPIPGNEIVVLWGWCGHILSGGRIKPVKHRVKHVSSIRRNTAVCFIAPNLRTPLQPLVNSERKFSDRITQGQVSVEEFKDMMGKSWRWREGTERDSLEIPMTQDEEIIHFLYGLH
jgi:isopenicillin N synthase-like dioxygenase